MIKEKTKTEKSPTQLTLDEASIEGRDWFPSGLYNLTGRGSTPLRSTILTVNNVIFKGSFVNEYFKR